MSGRDYQRACPQPRYDCPYRRPDSILSNAEVGIGVRTDDSLGILGPRCGKTELAQFLSGLRGESV